MQLPFCKMHGLGNDFVVFDFIDQKQELTTEQIRFVADRHFGVGCDQLLIVEKPNSPENDVLYRIYNADGDEVEQCGNGARCIAVYLREKRGIKKPAISAETQKGVIHLYNEAYGHVRVDMGVPDFSLEGIGLNTDSQKDKYSVNIDSHTIQFNAASMGNPHAVIEVERLDDYPIENIAPSIQQHPMFKNSVNVGFMQTVDPSHIKLRVYERGVGETLACGTGACAAVVVGRQYQGLEPSVDVTLPGGVLNILWEGDGEKVWMTGPATLVFEGTINL